MNLKYKIDMSQTKEEELQLLRENNAMLKQILAILLQTNHNQYLKQFVVDYFANKTANYV